MIKRLKNLWSYSYHYWMPSCIWYRTRERFQYTAWWLFIERIIYAQHNARVIAEFEERMSLVINHVTGRMSKPYYTWPDMRAEIDDAMSRQYDDGYSDGKQELEAL